MYNKGFTNNERGRGRGRPRTTTNECTTFGTTGDRTGQKGMHRRWSGSSLGTHRTPVDVKNLVQEEPRVPGVELQVVSSAAVGWRVGGRRGGRVGLGGVRRGSVGGWGGGAISTTPRPFNPVQYTCSCLLSTPVRAASVGPSSVR